MKVERVGIVYPTNGVNNTIPYQSYGDHWLDAAKLVLGEQNVVLLNDIEGNPHWGSICDADVDFLLFIENLPLWFKLGEEMYANAIRIPKLLYCWDTHLHYFTYLQSLRNHFDKIFVASKVDADRLGVEWLPPAYNELLHRPLGLMKKWDIGFIGQQDNVIRRIPGMLTRLEALEVINHIYKGGRAFIGQGYYGNDYVRLMNECRCMFDWPTHASVGTRFYEALGMGIPIISSNCFDEREQSELVYPVNTIFSVSGNFPVGGMMQFVRDTNRLNEIIQYQIDFCQKHRPTYTHRFEEMVNKVEMDALNKKVETVLGNVTFIPMDKPKTEIEKSKVIKADDQTLGVFGRVFEGKTLGVVIPTQFAIPTINTLIEHLFERTAALNMNVNICVVGPKETELLGNVVSDTFSDNLEAVSNVSSYIESETNDFTARVNLGLDQIGNSDYILICNDDIVMAKDALENMLAVLADYKYDLVGPISNCDYSWQHEYHTSLPHKISVFGIGMDYKDENFEKDIMNAYSIEMVEGLLISSPDSREWVAGYFMLFRRDVLETYGKFDESMKMVHSDQEYCSRLPKGRVGYCMNAFVFHYGAVTRKREEKFDKVLYHKTDKEDLLASIKLTERVSRLSYKRDMTNVIFYAGQSWEKWSVENLRTSGIGGSESCQLYLANELSKLGYKVDMYYDWSGINCGFAKEHGWQEFDIADINARSRGIQTVVIYVRQPYQMLLDARTLRTEDSKRIKTILWNHDVAYGNIIPYENIVCAADVIVNLSHWHKEYWETVCRVPSKLIKVIGDGVDYRHSAHNQDLAYYKNSITNDVKDRPMKLIYASSYDRGLDVLLEILKKVSFPWTLGVYYGSHNLFKTIESLKNNALEEEQKRGIELQKWYDDMISGLGPVNEKPAECVGFYGRVDEDTLVRAFQSSDVWCYPTYFSETFCITALYAQLAGCHIISRPLAALATTLDHRAHLIDGDVYDVSVQEYYISALEQLYATGAYRQPVPYKTRRNYIEQHCWKNVAKKWDYLISELIEPR